MLNKIKLFDYEITFSKEKTSVFDNNQTHKYDLQCGLETIKKMKIVRENESIIFINNKDNKNYFIHFNPSFLNVIRFNNIKEILPNIYVIYSENEGINLYNATIAKSLRISNDNLVVVSLNNKDNIIYQETEKEGRIKDDLTYIIDSKNLICEKIISDLQQRAIVPNKKIIDDYCQYPNILKDVIVSKEIFPYMEYLNKMNEIEKRNDVINPQNLNSAIKLIKKGN